MDNSVCRRGKLTGVAFLLSILLGGFIPLTIAGMLFSGTLDAQLLLQYYNHPSIAWVY
jgi:hypothetical protein